MTLTEREKIMMFWALEQMLHADKLGKLYPEVSELQKRVHAVMGDDSRWSIWQSTLATTLDSLIVPLSIEYLESRESEV